MRAILSERPGPPEDLVMGAIEIMPPARGEARIRVAACGINFPDLLMIEDRYQFTFARPFAPGIEISGIIDAVGEGVTGLSVGQRVVAQVDHGGLADMAIARVEQVYTLPSGVAFDVAAASLLTYGTSFHALRDRAALRAGETLLVLGAGGGVGLAAVQLGKLMGAHVIAAASSEQKLDAARDAGADRCLLYPTDNVDGRALAAQFKLACPNGADVIYDPVGGSYSEPALRAIAWEGRYLVIGFAGGIACPPLNLTLLKGCQIIGVFWCAAIARNPSKGAETVRELLSLIAAERITPPAPKLFSLEYASQAMTALRDRTAVGKLVVMVNQNVCAT